MRLAALLLLVACTADRHRSAEERLRDDFVRELVEREGAIRSFRLTSSRNVIFEAGFSPIEYDPAGDYHNHAFRYIGQRSFIRLRSHGDRPMKLGVYGWIDTKVIRSKPSVNTYVDGRFISGMDVKDDGLFTIESVVGRDLLAGRSWVNLTLELSSVGWHWDDPPKLRVALIYSFAWIEAP